MSERITGSSEQPDELEQMLSRLKPREGGVSRDRLMFLAGRQEVLRERASRRRWLWPTTTAASWLVTAAVAGLWMQSLADPDRQQIAHAVSTGEVAESPERPEPESVPAHPEAQVAASTETLSATSETTAVPHRPQADDPEAWRRNRFPMVDAELNFEDLPRLSMVGWRSRQLARRQQAEGDPSPVTSEPVVTQRATYAELMKLYLGEQTAPGAGGGIL